MLLMDWRNLLCYGGSGGRRMAKIGDHLHVASRCDADVRGASLAGRSILGGPGDAGIAKAMLAMLPKPKMKAMSNPFEEAQW